MAIYTLLSALKTWSEENGCCDFNGYLEDYITINESSSKKELFESLLTIDESLKIVVGLRLDIKSDVITNRIIRYKDALKNADKALFYPFIIYGEHENGEQRAIIVCDDSNESYICSKGLYYCMSEPGSIFDEARNEIISCSYSELRNASEELFTSDIKVGAIQRKLDQKQYKTYEELYGLCMSYANKIKENAKARLGRKRDQEKIDAIKEMIIEWFLIKKVAYVQYMMNKTIFVAVHQSNIKKQRAVAKENADKIPFYSFNELWRL